MIIKCKKKDMKLKTKLKIHVIPIYISCTLFTYLLLSTYIIVQNLNEKKLKSNIHTI